jgi:hypothetical protein
MRLLLLIGILVSSNTLFAQYEEVGPLMGNPQLMAKGTQKVESKANPGTFDSTFIYLSDTIQLPLFDDFSSNKFQSYNANYTDLGVTSDKVYRVLDQFSAPISNSEFYTQQQTFVRKFDIANNTTIDSNFQAVSLQLGDLSTYPVTHQPINAYPPFYIYDTLDYPNPRDTIWIVDPEIYQDSATQFFAPVSDPEMYWLDDEAFHNYTMALDPWSLGVATFDGLDPNGYPYAFGTTTSNYADHLTSKPIDMSALNAGDSVYMSFLFQPQGLCDAPEAGDSLILEFYEQGIDQWNEIWRGGGTTVIDFDFGHILVDSIIYFTDAFQFRFKNYGGLSGSLDHYHLDYVHLRSLSGYQDTLFKDFAWVYPIETLLQDYTSVPWDHYKNNFAGKMSNNVEVVIRNGSNIAENNSLAGSVEVSYQAGAEGSFPLPGNDLANGNLNYAPLTTYYSYHDFSSGYSYDETKLGDSQVFDILGIASAQFPNFTGNDSTYSQQVFENYYSYDDGSAELAYGPTGVQARLAIQYTPYEADSLIGAMIHFVPSVNDVSNKLFLLTVWDDNNGQPGTVIYEDETFFPRQPKYEYDRNIFTYYFLKDTMKLPINGTFYIGWRQFDPDRLNVGLDMNIPNGDKTFYSVDNGTSWNQSGFDGSVMIRPIFSTALDVTMGIQEEVSETVGAVVYPNPTTGQVNIDYPSELYTGAEVYNTQGQLILRTDSKMIDLGTFDNGLYLIKVDGLNKVHKVLKR